MAFDFGSILKMVPKQLNLPKKGDDYVSQIKGAAEANKAEKGSGDVLTPVLGMLGSVAGGITPMITQWQNAMEGADVSEYENRLADMAAQRGRNYLDNSALLQDYNNQAGRFSLDASGINPTIGQSAMNVGSSMMSGAMAGLEVGGGWGALAGAIVGLGSGIGADIVGRQTNELKTRVLNLNQDVEQRKNQLALTVGAGQAQDAKYRNLFANRAAFGGFLRSYRDVPVGYRIHRSHCGGGTLVRIKTK